MSEKIEKLLSIWVNAKEIGKENIAEDIFKTISKSIKFIRKDDWTNHQICGDFPKVDKRCLVFCCSPAKNCPFRNVVLQKMGLSVVDYTKMKEKFAEQIKM